MNASDLLLAGTTTLVGAGLGLGTAYYFFRRGGAARPKIVIGLEEIARIDPGTVGVQVQMKVGTTEITNLVLLEVSVTNRGPRDLVIDDANDLSKHPLRPRVELPLHFRALADPWNPGGSTPAADIRVARQLHEGRQVFFVHIHRLGVGTTARARIVCTYTASLSVPPLRPDALQFFRGFLPDVTIQSSGLLAEPATLLDR